MGSLTLLISWKVLAPWRRGRKNCMPTMIFGAEWRYFTMIWWASAARKALGSGWTCIMPTSSWGSASTSVKKRCTIYSTFPPHLDNEEEMCSQSHSMVFSALHLAWYRAYNSLCVWHQEGLRRRQGISKCTKILWEDTGEEESIASVNEFLTVYYWRGTQMYCNWLWRCS